MKAKNLMAIGMIGLMLGSVIALQTAESQDATAWTWTQPDPTGDFAGAAPYPCADITAMYAKNDATYLVFRIECSDFSTATGDFMYLMDFVVGETKYQAGVQVTWAGGQAAAEGPNSWTDNGADVLDKYERGSNYIDMYIKVKSIKAKGVTTVSEIAASVTMLVGIVGPGATKDTCTPTVEPTDYVFVAGGGVLQNNLNLDLTSNVEVVEIKSGQSGTFTVTATNIGNASVSATIVANISNGWTIDPASTQVTVDKNGTQSVTYTATAPSAAKVGDTATITITGAKTPLTVTAKVVSGEGAKGKTPGFEILSLISAIGAAVILLNRRR